jgi:hypothetical protein
LKDKILNDEGRKQQSKLRELAFIASRFDCTLAQLAIGKFLLSSIQLIKMIKYGLSYLF